MAGVSSLILMMLVIWINILIFVGGVASTWFVIDPIQKCAVILMTQLIPSSVYPIRNQLRYLYHWFLQPNENNKWMKQ